MDNKDELIKEQEAYIEFLSKNISDNAVFLFTHGQKTSEETIQQGETHRERIKQLKESIIK